jgi:electron transfer flavoprotein beta subunit
MKILVTAKRVPDPDARLRITGDGTGIVEGDLAFVINPFDAIALEEALQIRERRSSSAEILVVSIGGLPCEDILRIGMAMGADRALLVRDDRRLDPWNIARILAALVAREHPDIVLLGKQAIDDDSNQVGQMLAALLDWPQATFASKIDFDASDERILRVERETDEGLQRVRLRLPAVLTADLRLNEPRYASLPSLMKARKKAIEHLRLEELDVVVTPRVELVGLELASSHRTCTRVSDVAELLTRLRNEAKVL